MQLLDLHLGRPRHPRRPDALPDLERQRRRFARLRPGRRHGRRVSERAGSAVVAELVLTNSGRPPALVLEGELLEGGQQHRVAARSALVGAGDALVLDVRCVEEGRWPALPATPAPGDVPRWRARRRGARRYVGPRAPLRAALRRRPHGSLLDATRDAGRGLATQLVAGIRRLPFQSGVLICLAGQPVQLEAYDSPRTLAAVWDALLQSAALDALDAAAGGDPGSSSPSVPRSGRSCPGERARRRASAPHCTAAPRTCGWTPWRGVVGRSTWSP